MSTNTTDLPTYELYHNVEYIDRYCPGGYHPIEVNDRLNQRYHIVDKLGQGGYSTIWLARDEELNNYVAIKVGTADQVSKESVILLKLAGNPTNEFSGQLITQVLDHFTRHTSLHSRALAAQLILATAYVHRAGFVHGDIHLGNVLLQLPGSELDHLSIQQVYEKYYEPDPYPVTRTDGQPVTSPSVPKNVYTPNWLGKPSDEVLLPEARLWLADFGTAFNPSQETRLLSYTHLQNRPPEAVFDSTKPLTFSSDIWSLGLMVWECMGSGPFMGGFLFDEDEVIADRVDALGPLPHEWWEKWETRTNVLTEDGQRKGGIETWPLQKRFDLDIQRETKAEKLDDQESRAFLDMVKGMLRFRPEERMTADQVLRSEWMSKWALPLAEKAWERKLLD
ncbi:kinase domain protein [Fusarium tjaetaba]|uniref:Kinase domain protein n=1 Tax=Fusarium tjaetaba TaxID=1567544 RepID=A0A8H5VW57_9HYPO|nr:kinase domain protein [Fusarium tjaetaba]KAF5635659.1 kinase domain protein [Fusarium tjaetaba]